MHEAAGAIHASDAPSCAGTVNESASDAGITVVERSEDRCDLIAAYQHVPAS